jgi:sec-independent protein translocase protein TatB
MVRLRSTGFIRKFGRGNRKGARAGRCVTLRAMFGMSGTEIALILVLALLLFGPARLPQLARTLGKGLRDFKRATDDIRSTVEREFYRMDQPPPPIPPVPSPVPEPSTDIASSPALSAETGSSPPPAPAAEVVSSSGRAAEVVSSPAPSAEVVSSPTPCKAGPDRPS